MPTTTPRLLPIAAVIALSAVLAACGGDKQAETPAQPATVEQPEAKAPVAPGKQLETPLPDGIVVSVPYNTVYDKNLPAKDGSSRRRVIVEFLAGDVNSIGADLDKQFSGAGYRKGKPRDEKGGTRVNYARKADGSKVSVLIRPRVDQRFRDERALGTVSFSWAPPKQ